MSQALLELGLFTAKSTIILLLILIILIAFFTLLAIAKSKQKQHGKFVIKNLNKKYEEATEAILTETLPKKELKKFFKDKKTQEKARTKAQETAKNVYIINFNGDIKASQVASLREEITVILSIAKPTDEVVVRLESPGGVVHGYGLAAAQLMRLRAKNIPLTITIDKVAASGGYMMACVGNQILAAPFSIIGSIGVIVQLPNFHRLLKDKHIDFEQHTAGEFKRTITMFGENTQEGREKLQHEIEDIHQLFKNLITENRPQINIAEVATGEHWLGQQALGLKLVDKIETSDDYLFNLSKTANLYEICYEVKKPFLSRFTESSANLQNKLFKFNLPV